MFTAQGLQSRQCYSQGVVCEVKPGNGAQAVDGCFQSDCYYLSKCFWFWKEGLWDFEIWLVTRLQGMAVTGDDSVNEISSELAHDPKGQIIHSEGCVGQEWCHDQDGMINKWGLGRSDIFSLGKRMWASDALWNFDKHLFGSVVNQKYHTTIVVKVLET